MKKKLLLSIGILLLIAAAVGIWAYSVSLRKQKKREEWIHSPTIHEGISVGGVSVGGLTVEQAEQALQEQEQILLSGWNVTLQIGDQREEFSAAELGLQVDAHKSAQAAYELGREGSYSELSEEIESLQAGKEVALSYQVEQKTARQLAAALAEQYDVQPENAWIEVQDGEVVYHEEKAGHALRGEDFCRALRQAAQEGRFTSLKVPLSEVQAEVPLSCFTPGMVRRASAATSFGGTADYRGQNIQKATELLDGLLLQDGEVFSMNEVLGDRTEQNGWLPAPAIVDGGARREDQAGGGVCQVSTTLYNAVAKADLSVTYRRNHSAKVGYVEAGLDATINTGTIDFTWENHTGGDILIHAWIEEDTQVCIEIYGLPFDGFDEIRLQAEHVGDIRPSGEMEVVYDDTKQKGYEQIEVPRQNGSAYTSYKLYYRGGELIKKEKLADSKYRAQNGVKIVGTGKGDA